MRRFIVAVAASCVAASVGFVGEAKAQLIPQGIALDRFNPSERGSEWFALDSLDMRGEVRPAFGVVGDYANRPLVLYNNDGSVKSNVVAGQAFLHVGGSLVLGNWIRVAVNLPVALFNVGNDGGQFQGPDILGVGDARFGLDIKLFGKYGDAARMAIGGQFFIPSGEGRRFTGDDFGRGVGHFALAGDVGIFTYAAKLGMMFRGQPHTFNGAQYGDELQYAASVGLRVADKRLVLGPEFFGASVFYRTGNFFQAGSSPAEIIFGAHYTTPVGIRVGAGAGPGITYDIGSPRWRGLISLEWTPDYHEPVRDRDGDGIPDKEDACPDVKGVRTDNPATNGCPEVVVPKPSDRDGDGVLDKDDACPDVPGVPTDDPKTNGCPADRDKDGVPDKEDACPDVPGVKTDDPRTNGCPADRDKDGIIDSEDACPDVPGVKTNDPKTNGCPPDPDRDKDGIPNDKDACPDQAGPADPDPTKNGCPRVAIVGTQIKILDQVKFATGSAILLPASDPILKDVHKILTEHPEIAKVRVEGHTDNQGPAGYNKTLSKNRAASVVTWLVKHGIDKNRLDSQGWGMEKPIDDNGTAAGRQNNRRVEFHIEQ